MTKPNEVFYNDKQTRDQLASSGIKNLEFVVVNNPGPSVAFEELDKFDFSGMDMSTFRPPANNSVVSIENITIPGFKVTYNTFKAGVHEFPLDNYSSDMTIVDVSDESKASNGVILNKQLNLQLAYINRFNVGLEGVSTVVYKYADGTQKSIITDNSVQDTSLCWDSVPLGTVFSREAISDIPEIEFSVTEGTKLVIYTPLKVGTRYDLAANTEQGNLHKFEAYNIGPNQSVQTKVFSDAKYALIQVCKGSATIGGYDVGEQNFYELDATQSITITAGPLGCLAVLSVNVESINI